MASTSYDFSPEAAGFYDRLDISEDAEQKTIKKAGKLAYKQYAEGDRDEFFPLREAREALSDVGNREAYDRFVEAYNNEAAAELYARWNSRGADHSSVEMFIRKYGEETAPTNQESQNKSVWEQISIDDPVISWTNGKPAATMSVNLWDEYGKRLYINNLHKSGDIYLDLETGTFYNNNYDIIDDVSYNVMSEDKLYIDAGDIQVKISLSGGIDKALFKNLVNVNNPEVISSGNGASPVVDLWEDKRLYIENFHPEGKFFIKMYDGRMWFQNKNKPVDKIYYSVDEDDNTLSITYDNTRTATIELDSRDKKEKSSNDTENGSSKDKKEKLGYFKIKSAGTDKDTVKQGEEITIYGVIENTGKRSDTQNITIKHNGEVISQNRLPLTYRATTSFDYSTVIANDAGTGQCTLDVQTENDSKQVSFRIKQAETTEPPLDSLTIQHVGTEQEEFLPDDTVEINTKIANPNEQRKRETVRLRLGDEIVDSNSHTFSPDSTGNIRLRYHIPADVELGEHEYEVNIEDDVQRGSFAIIEPEPGSDSRDQSSSYVYKLVIGICLVAFIYGLYTIDFIFIAGAIIAYMTTRYLN